ncbi:hypothetical protein DM01DRAFT_1407271 [Hesseltinella vesiculosa]|uniref:SWI/SNF-like complex subunit BAF250 C-terminal domain-containing protein n=1 Tax=Hesseltinella vesiculosa TaxID=101127 RepID=A0A1X2GI78_9FUNG|nr:hypothetical protein DM01DRAFT_1407271 [Hesseltinella vesiculosa]
MVSYNDKPVNPMLAMIQRQQMEQQQYEALAFGKTMGTEPSSASATTQPASSTQSPSTPEQPPHSSSALSSSAKLPTHPSSAGPQPRRQRQPQYPHSTAQFQSDLLQQTPFNVPYNDAMYGMYRPRQMYSDPSVTMMTPPMPMMGPYSPNQSPAPNHIPVYSQMDMMSMYYQTPSVMPDANMSYMNMMPGGSTIVSPPMYQIPPGMSASPMPQMPMNMTGMASMQMTNIPMSMDAMPHSTNVDMTSNLTSKPVQTMEPNATTPLSPSASTSTAPQLNAATLTPSSPMSTSRPTHASPSPRHASANVPSPTASPSMDQPSLASAPLPSSATPQQLSSSSPTTDASTTTAKLSVYIPKTRLVDTYGGIDVKYFDKFNVRPPIPFIEELGMVDIGALIMSLKSGLPMELTNALNIMTTLSVLRRPIHLSHCDDLLDTLLDRLEVCTRTLRMEATAAVTTTSEQSYPMLFESSLQEMKSLIPVMEKTSSETWLPYREQCWCLLNIFRNLSYLPENQAYMAEHPRFLHLLTKLVTTTDGFQTSQSSSTPSAFSTPIIVTGTPSYPLPSTHTTLTPTDDTSSEIPASIFPSATTDGMPASPPADTMPAQMALPFQSMDILDCRKALLMIFANVALMLGRAPTLDSPLLLTVISLLHDFFAHGQDTYYASVALDTWNKLLVRDFHRMLLIQTLDLRHGPASADAGTPAAEVANSGDNTSMLFTPALDNCLPIASFVSQNQAMLLKQHLTTMWTAMIKHLRSQFYLLEVGAPMHLDHPQLATLEQLMMGLFNLVAVADSSLCCEWTDLDPHLALTISRICITMALTGQPHFRVAAHRSLDMVFALVLGGGAKVVSHATSSDAINRAQTAAHRLHFPVTAQDLEEDDPAYRQDVAYRTAVLLHLSAMQDRLVMAMIKPNADTFILNLLDELISTLASFSFNLSQ